MIVDYAHTDDALRNLTTLARQMTAASGARVITMFGCGGDRDRTKRPRMDRASAIRLALEAAKPGDVVLLAGKGHEKEQILAGRTIPFDDAEVALSILAQLGYREGQ